MKSFYKVTTKNGKKRFFLRLANLLEFLVLEPISRVPPCESSRPRDSENVVLFGRATFLRAKGSYCCSKSAEGGKSGCVIGTWFHLVFSHFFLRVLKAF